MVTFSWRLNYTIIFLVQLIKMKSTIYRKKRVNRRDEMNYKVYVSKKMLFGVLMNSKVLCNDLFIIRG